MGLHVRCPMFCSDFNQIWSFSADFLKGLRYQMSRITAQWEPRWHFRTDRRTEIIKQLSSFRYVCENTWKGKMVPIHVKKAYKWSRGKAPVILTPGTTWRWMVNFAPRSLYARRKKPRYQFHKSWMAHKVAWTISRTEKESHPCRESKHSSSAVQPVA
jgi:hypothetical protein